MIKKIILWIFIFTLVVLICFLVLLTKPYMDYSYVRESEHPVKLIAEYYNVTGEPLCTKLYLVKNNKRTGFGIFPNIPSDLPDPHTVELQDGDRIEIEGYTYLWKERNILTDTVNSRKVNVVDLLSWRIINSKKVRKESYYVSSVKNHAKENFKSKNYTDCVEN